MSERENKAKGRSFNDERIFLNEEDESIRFRQRSGIHQIDSSTPEKELSRIEAEEEDQKQANKSGNRWNFSLPFIKRK